MQQLSKGATLQGGKYIIERVLGQGGFGITYLATHSFLEKQVAIKEFFPKDFCERNEATSHIILGNANTTELVAKLKEKFLKEAKNISKFDHPGIVKIFDIFQENGTAYYIMDYIDGEPLSSKIKQNGFIAENEAIYLLRKVAASIHHIHSRSMNHLDIKPANIMIRNKDGEPILIDFGLSKQYDSVGSQTSTTPIGISHGFAPIEQYMPGGVSSFSPQTDIYALGATLYAMLTGKNPPHYGEILESGIPEYPSSVSEKTKKAIEHALEIKKNKRPQTIEEFLKHFDGFTPSEKLPQHSLINSNDIIEIDIDIESQSALKDNSLIEPKSLDKKEKDELIDQLYATDSTEADDTKVILNSIEKEIAKDDTRISPKISISKKRGMNFITRDEIIEVSWSVTDAIEVYLIINNCKKIIVSDTGSYTLNKKNGRIKIHAISKDNIVSESETIYL